MARKVTGSFLDPVKSDTVSPMVRHRCDVSSELCCPGAKPRRWAPPFVLRFGVIAPIYGNKDLILIRSSDRMTIFSQINASRTLAINTPLVTLKTWAFIIPDLELTPFTTAIIITVNATLGIKEMAEDARKLVSWPKTELEARRFKWAIPVMV